MLVLTRRNQEAVVVGRPSGIESMFKVTVLEINAGSVRLGFEGNKDCPVHRWEVWQRIHDDSRSNLPGRAIPRRGVK